MGMAQSSSQTLYGAPKGPNALERLSETERKTLCEVLLPTAPPKEKTKGMANADSLNPPEVDILALALGAPARRVLERADLLGPLTGWRDGFLSTKVRPDPSFYDRLEFSWRFRASFSMVSVPRTPTPLLQHSLCAQDVFGPIFAHVFRD